MAERRLRSQRMARSKASEEISAAQLRERAGRLHRHGSRARADAESGCRRSSPCSMHIHPTWTWKVALQIGLRFAPEGGDKCNLTRL